MAKKRQSPSRAERVAVSIGSALGRFRAGLDRLSALGPNTSGDQAEQRKTKKKAAKKSTKLRRKVPTAKSAPEARKKAKQRR